MLADEDLSAGRLSRRARSGQAQMAKYSVSKGHAMFQDVYERADGSGS